MTTMLVILGVIGAYTLFCYFKGREKEMEDTTEEIESVPIVNEKNLNGCPTRELLMHTLRRIGCEPLVEGDEGAICFDYQGERFLVESSNECLFINLYDTWWYRISMDADIEEFANMQKAVNLINGWASCTALYTINQEERIIGLHLKKNMLFVSQIPELEQYLKSTFEDFFKTQRALITEMEKNKVRQKQM